MICAPQNTNGLCTGPLRVEIWVSIVRPLGGFDDHKTDFLSPYLLPVDVWSVGGYVDTTHVTHRKLLSRKIMLSLPAATYSIVAQSYNEDKRRNFAQHIY